jgi:hypothetical protein
MYFLKMNNNYKRQNKNKSSKFGKFIKNRYSNPQKIASDLAFVMKMVNAEKMPVHYNNSTTIGTGGSIQTPLAIAQGNDVGNRTGNSIRLSSLALNFSVRINSSASNTFVRMIVALDIDREGSTNIPAITDILDSADPLSFYNINQELETRRFIILIDKTFALSAVSNTNDVFQWRSARTDHVFYQGTSSAAASLARNTVSVFLLSSEGVNLPTYNLFFESKYYDN